MASYILFLGQTSYLGNWIKITETIVRTASYDKYSVRINLILHSIKIALKILSDVYFTELNT